MVNRIVVLILTILCWAMALGQAEEEYKEKVLDIWSRHGKGNDILPGVGTPGSEEVLWFKEQGKKVVPILMELYVQTDDLPAKRQIVAAVSRQGGRDLELLRQFRANLKGWGGVDANTEQEKSFLCGLLIYLGNFGEEEDFDLIRSFGDSNHVMVRTTSEGAERLLVKSLEKRYRERRSQELVQRKFSSPGNDSGSSASRIEAEESNVSLISVLGFLGLVCLVGYVGLRSRANSRP